jgi:hypothetical protein
VGRLCKAAVKECCQESKVAQSEDIAGWGMDEVSTVSWAGSAGTATASLWVDGTDCRSQRLVSQPQGVACVAAARAIATTVSGARMLR